MEQQLTHIEGTVENIVFRNNDNGYTVMDFDSGGDWITVVGEFVEISESECLILEGSYVNHPRYGTQFRVETYEQQFPDTAVNIEKYLASGAVRGIGARLAVKIVKAFGDKSLEIIEKEPQRLMEINGISPKKCKEIAQDTKRIFALRTIKTFFDKYKIKYAFAMRTYLHLGSDAIDQLQVNPYLLCNDAIGIDFGKADEIALDINIDMTSPYRISAGIRYILKENSMQGHSCLPITMLFGQAVGLLKISVEYFRKTYSEAVAGKEFFEYNANDITYVYLPEYYNAEKYIADRISSIRPAKKKTDCEKLIDDEEKKNNIKYESLQRKAISDALSEKAIILTGGPGTGKTTTLNAVISIFKKKGIKVFLAAPTGRAAKRMTELTGYEAKTIHRLLEMKFSDTTGVQEFAHNEANPLDCDAVIIDEMSMVDLLLFEALLRALKPKCKLIITGDSDQLPSVGAGNLLRDLVDGQAVTVIRLNEIFRQAQQSLIITNAHRIVSGQYPDLTSKDNDFFFFLRSNPELALQLVKDLVSVRLPKKYGYSPLDDIQVIAPSRKGIVGTNELNRVLQNEINPQNGMKGEVKSQNGIFRSGDKVMQNINNYEIEWEKNGEKGKGVFNGDIGRIISISKSKVTIDFDGRVAEYTYELLNQVELAYAITVHKSQGCEFEAVILPVQNGFDMLNHRNLLYTAVTRAKKLLILIGNEQIIYRMVDNCHGTERFTCLKDMLSENGKD